MSSSNIERSCTVYPHLVSRSYRFADPAFGATREARHNSRIDHKDKIALVPTNLIAWMDCVKSAELSASSDRRVEIAESDIANPIISCNSSLQAETTTVPCDIRQFWQRAVS